MGACASKPNEANGLKPTEAPPVESREISETDAPIATDVPTETDAPTEAKKEETTEAPLLVDISEPKNVETDSTEPQTPAVVEELASSLKELSTDLPAQQDKEEEKPTEKKEEGIVKVEETKEEETKVVEESKEGETKVQEMVDKEEAKAAN